MTNGPETAPAKLKVPVDWPLATGDAGEAVPEQGTLEELAQAVALA